MALAMPWRVVLNHKLAVTGAPKLRLMPPPGSLRVEERPKLFWVFPDVGQQAMFLLPPPGRAIEVIAKSGQQVGFCRCNTVEHRSPSLFQSG